MSWIWMKKIRESQSQAEAKAINKIQSLLVRKIFWHLICLRIHPFEIAKIRARFDVRVSQESRLGTESGVREGLGSQHRFVSSHFVVSASL
jgi:hypothetical protein